MGKKERSTSLRRAERDMKHGRTVTGTVQAESPYLSCIAEEYFAFWASVPHFWEG